MALLPSALEFQMAVGGFWAVALMLPYTLPRFPPHGQERRKNWRIMKVGSQKPLILTGFPGSLNSVTFQRHRRNLSRQRRNKQLLSQQRFGLVPNGSWETSIIVSKSSKFRYSLHTANMLETDGSRNANNPRSSESANCSIQISSPFLNHVRVN